MDKQMEIKELKKAIINDLWRIAPAYLTYFLVSAIILIFIFGTINYGANLPYLTSLLVIGIPFLVCFCHLMAKAENCRIKFTEAGGDTKAARNFMVFLIIIVPFMLLFITLFFFKLLESMQ